MTPKYLLVIDDDPEQEEIWEDYIENVSNQIANFRTLP